MWICSIHMNSYALHWNIAVNINEISLLNRLFLRFILPFYFSTWRYARLISWTCIYVENKSLKSHFSTQDSTLFTFVDIPQDSLSIRSQSKIPDKSQRAGNVWETECILSCFMNMDKSISCWVSRLPGFCPLRTDKSNAYFPYISQNVIHIVGAGIWYSIVYACARITL